METADRESQTERVSAVVVPGPVINKRYNRSRVLGGER